MTILLLGSALLALAVGLAVAWGLVHAGIEPPKPLKRSQNATSMESVSEETESVK